MRITGRSFGRAARGAGLSSIIKNSMAEGTTIPPCTYGKQRTCAQPVTVTGCAKAAKVDAPAVVEQTFGYTRKTGSMSGVIRNAMPKGNAVFAAKGDPGLECNAAVVNANCAKADNRVAPAVVEQTYGYTRKNGSTSGVIRNAMPKGNAVFAAGNDGRLTCKSYVNAHLR